MSGTIRGVPAPRVITLPMRATALTRRKRRVITQTIPSASSLPRTGFERWVQDWEASHVGCGHTLHNTLIPEDHSVPTIIEIPRKNSAAAITREQLDEAHASLQKLGPREAIVTCENMESENGARGRARSLAERYATDYAFLDADGNPHADNGAGVKEDWKVNPRRYLSSHAVPDPKNEGKFMGAVSVRADQTPPEDRPKPKPRTHKAKPAAKDAPAAKAPATPAAKASAKPAPKSAAN